MGAATRELPAPAAVKTWSRRQSCIGGTIRVRKTFIIAWLAFAAFFALWAVITFAPRASAQVAQPPPQAEQPAVRVATCHKVTPETYNRQIRKLDRIAPAKHKRHRAKHKVCKWTKYKPVVDQITELCRPIEVTFGKGSWFDDTTTSTGRSAATHAGLALNLNPGTDAGYNNSTTQRWVAMVRAHAPPIILVKYAGRSHYTTIVDTGPAGSTGRALDFSKPLIHAMGWNSLNFPTDSWGTAYEIRRGCR